MKIILLLVYFLSCLSQISARRKRRGFHIDPRIGSAALKGLHAAEGIAASGALGPEFKAAAIAAETAETAVKGVMKGESAEQIAKESAMTAANAVMDGSEGPSGSLKHQLMGMAMNTVENKLNQSGNNESTGAELVQSNGPSQQQNSGDVNANVNQTLQNNVQAGTEINQNNNNNTTTAAASDVKYKKRNRSLLDPSDQEPILLQVQQPPMILHVQPPPIFILHQPKAPQPLRPRPGYGVQMASQNYGVQTPAQNYNLQVPGNNFGVQTPNQGGYGMQMASQNYGVQTPAQNYNVQVPVQTPGYRNNYNFQSQTHPQSYGPMNYRGEAQVPAHHYNPQQFTPLSTLQAQPYPKSFNPYASSSHTNINPYQFKNPLAMQ